MKKMISFIIILVLLFFGVQILFLSNDIINTIRTAIDIWLNNIFPSLFPFFVLSNFLINYGFVEFLSELLKPITKFLKLNPSSSFILVMSVISGFPSNAKYTKELYLNNLIDCEEASKILTFTHFSNPLFILGTVAISFLQNKEVGFLILIVHYFTNIIIALIFRNYHISTDIDSKVSFKKAINNMHEKRINNHKTFGSIMQESLANTIQTLVLILGTITFFLVITTIIDKNININSYYQSILNGFLEMTQGLKYVSLLDIPLKLKSILAVMILSFGGLSVHFQVISIISDTKIKYLPFLTARILHAAISGILVFLLFDSYILFI